MQNFLAEIMNVHGAFNFHSRDLCVRNNSNWKKLQQNLIKLKTVEWGNSSFLFPCNNFGGLPVCVVNISHLFYPIFNIFDHSNSLNNITSVTVSDIHLPCGSYDITSTMATAD